MDVFEVPIEVLRLAEAIVFASPEPVTWQRLAPMLPSDLDPGVVFTTFEKHCAGPCRAGQGTETEARRLPRAATETLAVVALHHPSPGPRSRPSAG